MRHCPQCNAINEDDAATCIECGAALPRGSADFQTIDVIGTPLAEDAEIHATLDVDAAANANSVAKSFNGDMSFDGDVSIDVGQLDANQTVEYAAHATDAGADGEATLMLDDNTAVPIHAAQTLLKGTEGTDQRTIQNKLAQTVGQLEKVWASAAGSSVNPMQSLSGASMQAMDTIFQRVAVRKVLDANSTGLSDADYRIIDKLGEGGMGIVFTARQTAVDRLVALKAAKPKFQKSRDARKRFLYEAQITADLDHSNIVPIHDLGVSEDGMLFYSMKIVDGDQWSQVMANQTREQNLDIFMKVADAVAFAHSKGIIHRDLKPENTMLGKFGEVFVTDWGTAVNLKRDCSRVTEPIIASDRRLKIESTEHFQSGESIIITTDDEVLERNEIQSIQDCEIRLAKPLSRSSELTANLRIVKAFNLAGTPCYMAPEMAGHQLNKIGPASDIYVLGAILFDMVTGRPPHTGPTVTHCLMNALGNQLVIPEDAGDDALLSIALKAMSSDPKDRYQSVEEMQGAVRQYRRHAESIALTDRSADLLAQAQQTSDYQTYARAVFGFRDAIDLWPDNTAACDGLLSARLAYADSAYSKGDYDLVFQTVDCSVPAELELFEKAKQAKQRRSERESRIKLLQRLVATVVIIAIVGLSGLLTYALNEQRKAIQSAKAEKDAKIEAEAGRSEAEKAKIAAEKAQKNEEKQRIIAEEREKEAELRRKEAVVAQAAELEAKQDAQRKTIQIQLDEYKSSIALASSRLASFDVRSAGEILNGLLQKVTNISDVAPPAFDTWGWRRIRLLGNTDLPQTTIAGRVISSATAAQANLIALATDTGNIQVYKVESGVLVPVHSHQEPNATAISLAMSADGTKLAYAYTTRESSGIGFWIPDKGEPELVRSAVGKNFQNILISRDGQSLLAGISAGLWIWNIDRDGWLLEESPATRLNNVRGASLAVQEITDKEYLLTVDFNKERELRLVNVVDGANTPIEVPDSIRGSLNCALPIGNGQIALGLRDNRVAIANLKDRRLNVESILELKHSSAITKLALNPNGRFISMSDAEPVAQVWRKINDRWQYESYLTGLRDNLVDIATLSNGSLLGVDVSNSITDANRESRAIVWDIDRQTQRIRMERPIESEKGLHYPESVQHLVVGGFDGQVLSVDTNGCINAWNLLDGKVSDPTFSYLGHTPGAELVDSASSLESDVLVTVAKLRDAQRDYLSERRATWEFCLWNLESKQMVRRWTRTDEPLPGQSEPTSVEPRLTLVDQGRKLVLGSDSHTTIIDVETGREFLNRSDWGTYFAVENPSNKSELLLVKRTGAIRLLNIAEPRWDDGKIDDVSLKLASEAAPMHAVWSRNGSHVYLAYANGDVAKIAIVDQTAKILWHSQMLNNDPIVSSKSIRLKSGEVRVHTDMDLLLKQDGDNEELQYAIRTGSTDRRTHHVGIRFPLKSNNAILIDEGIESIPGNRWLKFDDANNIILTEELHESFAIDSRRVRVMQQFGKAIFISSRSAQTYALKRGSDSIESFARTTPRAVTGDRSGRVLYSLNKEGSMSKFHLADDSTSGLTNLNYQLPTADVINLSPNGKHLAVLSDGHLSVHDPDLGTDQYQLGQADAIGWNASSDAELASCSISNGITVFDADFKIAKQIPFEFKAAETVVGLHFLTETFGIPDIMPRRHLLVHTRDLESDYVNIVALDPLPNVLAKTDGQFSSSEVTNLIRQPITRNSLIAVSPAEGIFATGTDNGTVNVWYCSPTWGAPRELFDLSGHRGSKITSIAFTTDGNTLITADDNKRLFAWITKDPQGKK